MSNLVEYCNNLSEVCQEAGKWVERNSELVRNEKEGLLKELRRAGRQLRSCARAAGRKMCAGVFGPSQAGKSYLISALARGESNTLAAVFANETRDFISEINPEGGKESTGLVTRFTLDTSVKTPDGYPVQARLLSEMDLVKIIANTYYADCEHKDDPLTDISESLKSLKNRAGAPNNLITLDDMEDLREYLARNFRSKARVRELERFYWDEAFALAPLLDVEGRVRLYSIIWDGVEDFTLLLRKLLLALEKLGNSEEIFCSMDALIPRDKSIIDVATLNGLSGGVDGDISIAAPGGLKTSLPRSVVTALTAELTIVMRDKPADYFEHTDLLDFPGYRSRYKLEDVRKELKKEGMLKELFLRGKVAYLFQRYCAEKELNSMLLCIGPSNQEVQDLPGVINDWVCSTHGATPEERQNKDVSLFFILTKFDMEFEEKAGAPSLETRWDNRLHASLLDFFGKQHDWPEKWTPQQAFNNLFMLRNPNFKFKSVLNYEGDRETGVRPESQQLVEKLHSAFANSSLVAEHFQNPGKAWDAAMQLNDGGITYIRESLSPMCNPALKEEQLMGNINSIRNNLAARLKAFWQSDDKDDIRRQKAALIKSLFGNLGKLEKSNHRLGQLLRNFTVTDSFIYDLQPQALRKFRDAANQSQQPVEEEQPETFTEEIDLDSFDVTEFNILGEDDAETQTVSEDETVMMDENDFFASYIESAWVENLHQLADDPDLRKYYMLNARDFTGLASELATGMSRLGLKDKMSKAFHKASEYANTGNESIIRRQAAIAANMINSYIDGLGFAPDIDGKAREITLPGGKSATVFEPYGEIAGLPVLEDRPRPWTSRWLSDWLNALSVLIMDNVNFDGDRILNPEENRAIGAMVRSFETPPQTSASQESIKSGA